MMTINRSSRWKKLGALAAMPVIALALLAFANPSMNTVDEQSPAAPAQQSQVYKSVEQMPRFPGGEAALMKYLMTNVQYPENAAKNDIQGRVVVQFVVDENGEVGQVKVVRSIDEELDAEAIRVVKTLPKFEPGRQDGKAVSVWYTVPISFKLKGDSESQENQMKATTETPPAI